MIHSHILGKTGESVVCTALFYSILGCVLPLQDVALRKSPPTVSVLCYPCPNRPTMPSLQRRFGFPTSLICRSVLLIVNLVSFIRATYPAHFHFVLQHTQQSFIYRSNITCNSHLYTAATSHNSHLYTAATSHTTVIYTPQQQHTQPSFIYSSNITRNSHLYTTETSHTTVIYIQLEHGRSRSQRAERWPHATVIYTPQQTSHATVIYIQQQQHIQQSFIYSSNITHNSHLYTAATSHATVIYIQQQHHTQQSFIHSSNITHNSHIYTASTCP